jgi:hypothetical protein
LFLDRCHFPTWHLFTYCGILGVTSCRSGANYLFLLI